MKIVQKCTSKNEKDNKGNKSPGKILGQSMAMNPG